jgi:hypothetical protein
MVSWLPCFQAYGEVEHGGLEAEREKWCPGRKSTLQGHAPSDRLPPTRPLSPQVSTTTQ